MATVKETLALIVTADTKGAVREMDRLGSEADKSLKRTDRLTRDWGATLTRVGVGMVGFATVVGAGLGKAAMAADEAAQAQLRLDNTMANNPKLAGASRQAFEDLAKAMAKKTVVDDDAVISMEAVLGQFGLTQEQILQLTPLVVDLSRKMGIDMDTAAKAVGKAMNGSSGALKKFGIDLGDVEKGADNTRVVMDGLSKTVGGFAEGEAKTMSGQLQMAKRDLAEVQEGIGAGVIPVLAEMLAPIKSVTDAFQNLSPAAQAAIGKIAAIGTTAVGVLGTVSLVAGQVSKMRSLFLVDPTAGLSGGLSLAGKVATGATLGVGLFATAVSLMGKDSQEAEQRVNDLKTAVQTTGQTLGEASAQSLAETFGASADAMSRLENAGVTVADFVAAVQEGGDKYDEVRKKLEEAPLDLDNLSLFETGPVLVDYLDEQRKAFVQAKTEIEGVNAAQEQLTDAQLDGTKAAGALGTATEDAAQATGEAGRAATESTRATWSYTRQIREAVGALDAYLSRQRRTRGVIRDGATAQLDVADALDSVTQAQKDYEELQKSGTATTEELAAANRTVQRSVIDYYGTVDTSAESIIAAAKAEAGFKDNKENSTKATRGLIANLLEQSRTLDGPLKDAIDRYIKNLLRIPGNVPTVLSLMDEQARADFDAWIAYVEANPPTVKPIIRWEPLPPGISGPPTPVPVRANGEYLPGRPGGYPRVVGEAGPEVIIPLSRPQRARELAEQSGLFDVLGMSVSGNGGGLRPSGGGGGDTFVLNFNGPVASKREAERWVIDALKSARRRGDRDVIPA